MYARPLLRPADMAVARSCCTPLWNEGVGQLGADATGIHQLRFITVLCDVR